MNWEAFVNTISNDLTATLSIVLMTILCGVEYGYIVNEYRDSLSKYAAWAMQGAYERLKYVIYLDEPVPLEPPQSDALTLDMDMDDMLKHHMGLARNTNKYLRLLAQREKLPAYIGRQEIVDRIEKHPVVIVSGETGCGKTTQIPQCILDHEIEAGRGSLCRVVVTQPRRIAATSLAERVSEERGDDERRLWGRSVGYQIRLDSWLPTRTAGTITYCTTGIVTQWIRSDADLTNVSHLIIDEVHERDLNTDFLMVIIKQILQRRPKLRVVLMSATINAEKFSKYMGNAPVHNIPGRQYPVERIYLPRALAESDYAAPPALLQRMRNLSNPTRRRRRRGGWKSRGAGGSGASAADLRGPPREAAAKEYDAWVRRSRTQHGWSRPVEEFLLALGHRSPPPYELVSHLVYYIITQQAGDGAVLIFVSGLPEIRGVIKVINDMWNTRDNKAVIYGLHSKLSSTRQRDVFERPEDGRRKVIVATNIAETSITIDDVEYVIDCGWIKRKVLQSSSNNGQSSSSSTSSLSSVSDAYRITRRHPTYQDYSGAATSRSSLASALIGGLQPMQISKTNADQRAGRAGRVQKGYCYHLYTEHQAEKMSATLPPEMLNSELEELVLRVNSLNLGITSRDLLSAAMDPPSHAAVDQALRLLESMGAIDVSEDLKTEELTPLGQHMSRLPVEPKCAKMIIYASLFSCLDPILTVAATLSNKSPFESSLDTQEMATNAKRELAMGSDSDHLAVSNALHQWQQIKRSGDWKDARKFANEHFLNENTLRQIELVKSQLCRILFSLGYISMRSPEAEENNVNSSNIGVLKGVLLAGFYPKILRVKFETAPGIGTEEKGLMEVLLPNNPPPGSPCAAIASTEQAKVTMHRGSVNSESRYCSRNWHFVVFTEMTILYDNDEEFMTPFLFETTRVDSLRSLVLFSNKVIFYPKVGVVEVDGYLKIPIKNEMAEKFHDMRSMFSKILKLKVQTPSPVDWLAEDAGADKIILEIFVRSMTEDDAC